MRYTLQDHVRLGALLVCAWLGAGCSDYAPPLADVAGTLTYDGKPVPGMTVTFLPDNGRPSWGITDESGRYKLSWDADHPGVEIGKHKIIIAYVPGSPIGTQGYDVATSKPKKAVKSETNSSTAETAAIHARYGNIETTTLTREVKSGKQTIDLALSSKD
jgi:hypothetical protein